MQRRTDDLVSAPGRAPGLPRPQSRASHLTLVKARARARRNRPRRRRHPTPAARPRPAASQAACQTPPPPTHHHPPQPPADPGGEDAHLRAGAPQRGRLCHAGSEAQREPGPHAHRPHGPGLPSNLLQARHAHPPENQVGSWLPAGTRAAPRDAGACGIRMPSKGGEGGAGGVRWQPLERRWPTALPCRSLRTHEDNHADHGPYHKPRWPVNHESSTFEALAVKKALILSPAEIYGGPAASASPRPGARPVQGQAHSPPPPHGAAQGPWTLRPHTWGRAARLGADSFPPLAVQPSAPTTARRRQSSPT